MKENLKSDDVIEALCMFADENKAKILSRFFKTGKGEYGEGDIFLGLKNPEVKMVVKESLGLSFQEIQKLIDSPYHEVRLCGFLILVTLYSKNKKNISKQEEIVDFYLLNSHKANNWDLVDLSAPKILGYWLKDKDRTILYDYAKSENLWQNRIAIVSTWTIIREYDYKDTLALSDILISHPHDLIRKAVGWMLREVGKKDKELLLDYLEENKKRLSRTSLRYAIEKLSDEERQYFMKSSLK
ncbi:MAG: DNA alkylation repair protein [Bacteroidales bacterium]|nr:DNA alkylation repair protein [Bacteroidales bacterium]